MDRPVGERTQKKVILWYLQTLMKRKTRHSQDQIETMTRVLYIEIPCSCRKPPRSQGNPNYGK